MTRHAVILVGGRGTRLGPLTDDCPKPLLPVAGQPFLHHLISHLGREGITNVTLLAGYRGHDIAQHFTTNPIPGLSIETLIEPEPLGTGGALRFAADHLPESFILLNGDTFFDVGFSDLCMRARTSGALAGIALRYLPDTDRYGVVQRNGSLITEFATRPNDTGKAGCVNGGVYWLSRKILNHIGQGFVSLEKDVFPGLARQGHLSGYVYDGAFIDIGVPADLDRAQTFLPAALTRPALFLDRDGVINRDIGYLSDIEKFEWIPGAQNVLKRATELGWFIFVVTNQAGVARGLYDEAKIHKLHNWLAEQAIDIGARISDFRYCPYHPEGTVPAYSRPSEWRKPRPGMLLDLLSKHPVDKATSFMVGDKDTDVQAANAAGLRGIHFTGGNLDELVLPLLTPRRVPCAV